MYRRSVRLAYMGRIISIILIIGVGIFLFDAVSTNAQESTQRSELSPMPLATAPSNAFEATGALSRHLHGGVAELWLTYETNNSKVTTKQLNVYSQTLCEQGSDTYFCPINYEILSDLSSTTQVQVVGEVVAEHVNVSTISRVYGGDPSIALVHVKVGESASVPGFSFTPRLAERKDGLVMGQSDVLYNGEHTTLFFEEGAVATFYNWRIVLTHEKDDVLYFAVALEK